ncbi:MAG: amidohydrolase family protein [Hyphomonadaceae bacterium]|nr:amidohydrolase family protein [Hyphomonadaceae bacterium]
MPAQQSSSWRLLILTALLAGCTAAPVSEPVAPPPITVVMTEGTNMSATVSPDGSTIIASIQGTLWSMPGSGGKATALTAPELDAQEPAWSPDGKLAAFYAFADDAWSVWTIAPDGTGLSKRSAGPGDARYPSFSPDGKSLLYSTDGDGYSAVSLDLSSDVLTTLVDAKDAGYAPPTAAYFQKAGNVVYPVVSPDGTKLAYVVDGVSDTLYVRPLAGGAPKPIHMSETLGAPAWAPDGSGLYVVGVVPKASNLTFAPLGEGNPITVSETGDIFPFRPSVTADAITVTADGKIKTFSLKGGEATVTPFEAAVTFTRPPYKRRTYDFTDAAPQKALGVFDPALSPDGSQAVFTAVGDLWLTSLATGAVSKLTDDEAIDLSPSWSPDGAQIAFASDRGGKTDIWTLTLQGRAFTQLTDLEVPANSPVWSPDGKKIAFLKDARASIFLAGTVEVLDVATKKITHVADEIFGPSAPAWSPTGETIAVVARKPLTSRFREGVNAFMLAPADGKGAAKWVSPVEGRSLGRRQWNRPAWSGKGDMVYRIDDQLWSVPLDDAGKLGPSPVMITKSGENPSWSADGSKLIFVDGDKLNTWNAASGAVVTSTAAAMWTRAIPDTSYTIRAGKLFDGKGDAYQTNVDVLIERNVITGISPAGSRPVVGTLIDASTKTMIPGLIESHTHQSTSLGRSLGQRWFSYGITSVRETGADPYEVVERREAEASGRRPGPRVFSAGPLNEGGRVSYGISETVGTVELAKAAVARSTALKLDTLKSYVREDYTVQKAIIAEAHASGIPISGHELYPALANGADQVEHVGGTSRRGFSTKISRLNNTYQDVVALISQSGMIITPTLALHSRNGTEPIPSIQKTVKAIVDAGGRVVAGVDSPFVTFADSLHVELRLYVEAGIAPAHVLRLATLEAAKAIGVDSQIGSIEPGKIADLVLIDGDPLANITDTTKVAWVMKNGTVVWEKK